ncbi:NUAK family, SNF1-like kinase [Nematocida sp. LUAm3]|nr:NUAK family, SNF1-like kinase [Nematocida sp. LUAm3]KAI5175709.1 NUAK family, SNF1-like kinase [Nematocida sp. LUAm2]KAI5178615.1 NUAK family, SNF1-like kinase [Nematocida sp. LUAm1]
MKKESTPSEQNVPIHPVYSSSSQHKPIYPSRSSSNLSIEQTHINPLNISPCFSEEKRRTLSLPSLKETNHALTPPLTILPHTKEDPFFLISTKLIKLLGAGTVSKVFKAENPLTKALFVVKTIDTSTKEGMHASKNELIFLSKNISHNNIIKYKDSLSRKNNVLIKQEYFSEYDLYQFLSSLKKPPFFLTKQIISQLIDALIFLHKKNIAHLDIKPENILLNSNYRIKLIDFGSSKISLKNGSIEAYGGTPQYASPEAISGGIYNGFLSDSWSLGVLFFLMANGYYPQKSPQFAPEHTPCTQKLINGLLEYFPEKRTPISIHLKKDINELIIQQEKHEQ